MIPSGCVSLRTGTIYIAIFQLVYAIILLSFGILSLSCPELLTDLGFSQDDEANTNSTTSTAVHFDQNGGDKLESLSGHENAGVVGTEFLSSVSIIIISAAVFSILFSGLLLIGATIRNRTFCMIWFVLSLIGFIFMGIQLISSIADGTGTSFCNIYHDLLMLMNGCFLWVVWAFMKEIKGGPEQRTDSSDTKASNKPRV